MLQRDNALEKLSVVESERKLYEENLNSISKQREIEARNYQETVESLTKKVEDLSNYSEKVKSLSNQRNILDSVPNKQKQEKSRKRDEEFNLKANDTDSKPQKSSRDTNRGESHSPKQKSKSLTKSSPQKYKAKKSEKPKNFEEKVRAYGKRKVQSYESSSGEEIVEDCEPRFEEPKKKVLFRLLSNKVLISQEISIEEISEDPLSLKQQKKKAALASSSQDFDHLSKLKAIANSKPNSNVGRQSIRRDDPVKHKSNGNQKRAKLATSAQSKSNQKSRKDVDLFDDVFAFH